MKSRTLFILYSYSLEQTEQFLNCVLEADPVQTVIAQETAQQNEITSSYSAAKNREKKVFIFFLTIVTNIAKMMLMKTPYKSPVTSTI